MELQSRMISDGRILGEFRSHQIRVDGCDIGIDASWHGGIQTAADTYEAATRDVVR